MNEFTQQQPIRIRPGYLVTLSTKVEGGVAYSRVDLDAEKVGQRERTKWETERTITDVEEFEKAKVARSRVRTLVCGACIPTPFGLLCATDDLYKLDEALEEAARVRDEFNATAQHSRVRFHVLRGQIAETSAEAVAALRGELRSLLDEMQAATRTGSVKSIREVARRATVMGKMLEDGQSARLALNYAVRTARSVARDVVQRVQRDGENLEAVLAAADLAPIAEARFAFLAEGEELAPEPGVARAVMVGDEHEADELPAVGGGRFAALGAAADD